MSETPGLEFPSMKPKLYLETSIVSYLTARPSHDLIRAAHQQITRDWWTMLSSFDLYISQFVLDEARAGNPEAAERRLAALREASPLELTPEAGRLAREILNRGGHAAEGVCRCRPRCAGGRAWS